MLHQSMHSPQHSDGTPPDRSSGGRALFLRCSAVVACSLVNRGAAPCPSCVPATLPVLRCFTQVAGLHKSANTLAYCLRPAVVSLWRVRGRLRVCAPTTLGPSLHDPRHNECQAAEASELTLLGGSGCTMRTLRV